MKLIDSFRKDLTPMWLSRLIRKSKSQKENDCETLLVDGERLPKTPKGTRVLSKEQSDKLLSNKSNLLEIKLKDTDSVPEVWYMGEQVFEDRMVDVSYHYHTTGSDENDGYGINDIRIQGLDINGYCANEHPTLDEIIRTRVRANNQE